MTHWEPSTLGMTHLNSRISRASSALTGLLNATMPPNALMGSALTAARYASSATEPSAAASLAAPHGLVCLTMTHDGSGRSHTQPYAASAS